jgi:hypothetical protein
MCARTCRRPTVFSASRTDFVPRGVSGALVGLSLRAERSRTITLRADAHSELMSSYPWGETTPSQLLVNLADSAAIRGKYLLFRDKGTSQSPNFKPHDWAAAFGTDLSPYATKTGENFRGPQDPAVICPASGPSAPPQPELCDDTAYGKGVGGQLAYKVKLKAGEVKTIWFGVGGSTSGPAQARSELNRALDNPEAALHALVRARTRVNALSNVSLPGSPLLAKSVAWSKQMLAASEQRVQDLQLRVVNAGQAYPPPAGTLKSMRWLGAGWPDYSWLFGTDGEYTAFAAVAAGQFGPIKDHLRALRDVSQIVNEGSGKIVHEVTPDGAVYFGANADPGNTDESSKYPSAVALVWRWTGDTSFLKDLYPASVKAMKYVATLDEDGDGWPEGLGNVERPGMGEEKLDNAAYTIRGYADLADMAKAVGDAQTRRWAIRNAKALLDKFEEDWWYGGDADSYADSLDDPGNEKVFQRHWIDLTPTDAVLPRLPGRPSAPLASDEHANTTLDQHERSCFTGDLGLFHTGTGPTSAPAGNPGPSCDSVVSTVPSERSIFTLNSAIAAVRRQLWPARHKPAGSLHQGQRSQPTRPEPVGDARRHAGDRSQSRLRGQHRPAVHRAVHGDAGLGRVRRALAADQPVARRLTRHRSRPSSRRAATAVRASQGIGGYRQTGYARDRCGCRASGFDVHNQGDEAWPGGSAYRCGPAGWGFGHIGDTQRFTGQAQTRADHAWASGRRLCEAWAAYSHLGDQRRQLIGLLLAHRAL